MRATTVTLTTAWLVLTRTILTLSLRFKAVACGQSLTKKDTFEIQPNAAAHKSGVCLCRGMKAGWCPNPAACGHSGYLDHPLL